MDGRPRLLHQRREYLEVRGRELATPQLREIGLPLFSVASSGPEGAQSEWMSAGTSLRDQLDFARYRRRQADDPALTLRRYLAETGGAIET